MKKRNRTQSFDDITLTQKKSSHDLNQNKKVLIDRTIPEAFELNEMKIVYDILNSVFKPEIHPEKLFDRLIIYDKNRIIYWALEHENLELINYMIERASHRGKFLIICLNNYEFIDRYLQIYFKKLSEGRNNQQFFKDVYTSLLRINFDVVVENFNEIIQKYIVKFPDQSAKFVNSLSQLNKEFNDKNEEKSAIESPLEYKHSKTWKDKFKNSTLKKISFAVN